MHDHSRTLDGKLKTQLLLRLRSTSRGGDDGRVCVPHRSETTESGKLSSSTPPPHSLNAASESGLTQSCSYARARPKGDHASLALPAGLLLPPCLLPARPRRRRTQAAVGATRTRNERARRGAPSHLGLRFAVR